MPVPSSRDHSTLQRNFSAWLRSQLDADVSIDNFRVPTGSGFSSETFLFDASWGDERGSFVARMAPAATDTPVFPDYDLSLQVNAMRHVAKHTDVPVPNVRWFEQDTESLGDEFYVMDFLEGRAAPDNPPYVFGSWIQELSVAERTMLTNSVADGMAGIHSVPIDEEALAFLDRPAFGSSPLDQALGYQRWYYDWARAGVEFGCIERAFEWLEANRPANDPIGISWGDARIGNVMFADLEPVAFVDWEMACLGAPEVDVCWQLAMHQFFLSILDALEMEDPFPDLFRMSTFIGRYEATSGRRLADVQWYLLYGLMRFGIIAIRTSERGYITGEMERPADPEDGIMNKALIDATIAGTNPYWDL